MADWRERLWRFLGFGLDGEERKAALPEPVLEPPDPPPRDPRLVAAETALDELVGRLAARDARAGLAGAGAHIDALIETGHPALAAEWLEKLVTAAPAGLGRDGLAMRAATMQLELGDPGRARPHLERLTGVAIHAARAHQLLGEQDARAGNPRAAARHFEAVLAIDVDDANARAHLHALRSGDEPRAPSQPASEVTLVGPDGGAALAGARYRLTRELGRGATGVVYLARDAALARDVALKLLHPATGMAARARFFAEARVAAALRHPDIVAIFDVDEIHRFIVMECCRGGTLATRLRAGALSPADALAHHVEILSALAAAHRRGVVHRDLKPANLLYRHDPARDPAEIVVADFGAAHLAASGKDGDGPVGTLRYMAPEQRRGEASPAVDLYAAAVILAEMLGGRGESAAVAAPAPTLDEGVAAGLPAALAAELAGHLAALAAADPAARPSAADALVTARELHDRLRIARASA